LRWVVEERRKTAWVCVEIGSFLLMRGLKIKVKLLQNQSHKFCIAPMMDWSDRHCRAFHRTLSRRALVYTEMVTAQAVVRGDRNKLIGFDACEHPVALQLGGSDPALLAEAARIGEDFGYDEINLNVGCPSDRVQSGRFGACLMREPHLVAACMAAMGAAVQVPVTVKCRLGVDEQDPEDSLFTLVDLCAAAGVKTFVVHARKAWLEGLSPKENRDIPPLDYDIVRRLKNARPHLAIVLNGGLADLDQALRHLEWADGVMMGRAAYHTPGLLGAVDARVFGEGRLVTGADALARYRPYLLARLEEGVSFYSMGRHMLGLFAGTPGARSWRRILTVEGVKAGAGLEVLDRALDAVAAAPVRESLTAKADSCAA
jgi:tRNA-dihydrouridine synthase A